MKIVYCIPSICNSGGMERILSIKANFFADVKAFDVAIVTTDQKERPNFFKFSHKIKIVDLGINYCDNELGNIYLKVFCRFSLLRKHKIRLSAFLKEFKPDITISMFQHEASFLPSINDGSAKVIESHFCRYFRQVVSETKGIRYIVNLLRSHLDSLLVRRYEAFVTLTHEDLEYWPFKRNIHVIPNPVTIDSVKFASLKNKRVIAVGRITRQKGFDSLIKAWSIVEKKFADWKLTILGAQDDISYLTYISNLIDENNLESVEMIKPTSDIENEYLASDLLVMSSLYEGLPLAIIEGMSVGLPCVSFACKCGPKDLIRNGVNGFLVAEGDFYGLAQRIMDLLGNHDLLQKMGQEAIKTSLAFQLDNIMERWMNLFFTVKKKEK